MSDPPSIPYPGVPGIPPIPVIDPFYPIRGIPPLEVPPPLAPTKQSNDPGAKQFFLPPVNDSDPLSFRGPLRDALNVSPIIDGKEIFIELEKAIMRAETSALIAFWALDPEMKTITDPNITWMQMLTKAAERGVIVRILWNDFDPGLRLLEHATAWKRYWIMLKASASIAIDKFQMVCSHHEAETSAKIIEMIRPGLYNTVADTINKEHANVRKTLFSVAPGLWDKLNLNLSDNTVAPKDKKKSYPAWPAVHHQKIVIVDGKYAYTGGLNITDQYVDTQEHKKPELPWHDAFVKVEGSTVIRDFIRNYVGLWNQERVRTEAFLKNAYSSLNVKATPTIRQTTDLTEKMIPAVLTSTVPPRIPCQVHRTISKKGSDPTGVPITVREDILEGYLLAIGQAKSYIYIENQYFREKKISDAIIRQHKVNRDLQTIILLPRVIEEFLNSKGDELSQHGAVLQFENLELMKQQIGANLGLFSMVRNANKLIYVHSKLCIIDDKFAIIGSANSNPRSYKVDTELDLVWYDAAVSQKLRIELWNEILGNPSTMKRWKPSQYISKWSEIAEKNIRGKASAQKGFVIPFKNENMGKRNDLLSPFV